jgi:hypothetical protein
MLHNGLQAATAFVSKHNSIMLAGRQHSTKLHAKLFSAHNNSHNSLMWICDGHGF